MNEQTPQQTAQTPPVPAPQVPTPVVPAPPVNIINSTQATSSVNTPLPQNPTNGTPKFTPPDPKQIIEKIKSMPRKYKIIVIWLTFLFMLLIIVAATGTGRKVKNLILPTATPIPTVVPVGEVFVPSPYANDAEVLEIEKNVNDYDANLRSTELREDTLRVPSVDWDIKFD